MQFLTFPVFSSTFLWRDERSSDEVYEFLLFLRCIKCEGLLSERVVKNPCNGCFLTRDALKSLLG